MLTFRSRFTVLEARDIVNSLLVLAIGPSVLFPLKVSIKDCVPIDKDGYKLMFDGLLSIEHVACTHRYQQTSVVKHVLNFLSGRCWFRVFLRSLVI